MRRYDCKSSCCLCVVLLTLSQEPLYVRSVDSDEEQWVSDGEDSDVFQEIKDAMRTRSPADSPADASFPSARYHSFYCTVSCLFCWRR